MIKVAYSDIFKYDVPERHRFPMQKYPMIAERLLAEGTFTQANFFAPQRLSEDEILTTHTQRYWQHLKQQTLPVKDARAIGFEMTPRLVERERVIAHGTYECALFAKQFGVALNIAGGTHHAFADHGEGFCVFNDVAVASTAAPITILVRLCIASSLLVLLRTLQGGTLFFNFPGCAAPTVRRRAQRGKTPGRG